MNWLLKLAKAAGPMLAEKAWPRVKAAGKAAWKALREPLTPTEPPREGAPEVSRDE
jgi:hypothetical protein